MKLLTALSAGRDAFKAVLYEPSEFGPEAEHDGRFWDALGAFFGALWGALRTWGGTTYTALATAAAANSNAGRGLALISDATAALPLIAYRKANGADEELADYDLLDALTRKGNWRRIADAFVWGVYCGGECFLVKRAPATGPNAGRARVVRALRNDQLAQIKRDAAGDPVAYVFNRPQGRGSDTYAAADVLHVKTFNPTDEERGLPVLISARRALTKVEEADTWNRSVASGGGRMPGILSPQNLNPGQTLTADQVKAAQAATDEQVTKARKKNLPLVTTGAFAWQMDGVSPREADWLKGRAVDMREIASVMGVPATLLADEKAGSLTDAGVDSEVAALIKLTVQPRADWLLAEISGWLCPDGERIAVDWDQVPALQESIDAKFKRYADPNLPLTEKEKRVALGYDAEPAPEMADDEPDEDEPPTVPPVPTEEDEAEKALKTLRLMSPAEFDSALSRAA